MRSSYKKIGSFIKQVNIRNKDLATKNLQGISINKFFMPSVANITGTDLSKYKVVAHKQFAFNPMHVGRDEVLPISMLKDEESVIVSPAYVVFKVKDESELLPEYLMMWCMRAEFDRNAWFTTDSSVRGGFGWKDFCDLPLPVPEVEKQREIIREYHAIVDRIKLKEQLNQKLEETAQTIYKQWFVDFEFPVSEEYASKVGKPEMEGKPYKSSGGEMVWNDELAKDVPLGWYDVTLGSVCSLVTKGTTPTLMYDQADEDLIPFIKGEVISELHSINENMLTYVDKDTHETFLKRSQIRKGDILFTIAGTLGKFALVNDRVLPANINQAVAIIRISEDKVKREFIIALLLSGMHIEFYRQNIQQAVQANFSLTTIKSLPVLLPNTLTLSIFSSKLVPLIDLLQSKNIEIQLLRTLADIVLAKMTKTEAVA